jgi:type IV secretion system protein VirD4
VRRLLIDIEQHPGRHARHPTPLETRSARRPTAWPATPRRQPIAEVHPEVWLGAMALRSMEPRVRSSVLATAQKSLALWADPLVSNATSWSDFCIGDLVCAPTRSVST